MYRSGSSAKNEYSVIGEYYTYNGNGHTVNLYPSKTNRTQYKSILSSMASEEVLGDATIAVIFSFYVYSKDLDMWSLNYILIEKGVQGFYKSFSPVSLSFKPNKFEGTVNTAFYAFDIIKVSWLFGYCIYYLIKGFYFWKFKKTKTLIVYLREIVISLTVIALVITYCVYHFDKMETTKDLLKIAAEKSDDSFIDLYHTVSFYHTSIRIEGIMIIINCFLAVIFLRIIPTINFLLNSIKLSMKIFVFLGIYFVIVIISYAVIAMRIWGDVDYYYKDFSWSMLSIFTFFELRVGDTRTDLNDKLSFGYEKFFGFVLIVIIMATVLSFSVSVAVVLKAYERESLLFEESLPLSKDKPHYLKRWFTASYIPKVIPTWCCKKKREENYIDDARDKANVDMIRNIGKRKAEGDN